MPMQTIKTQQPPLLIFTQQKIVNTFRPTGNASLTISRESWGVCVHAHSGSRLIVTFRPRLSRNAGNLISGRACRSDRSGKPCADPPGEAALQEQSGGRFKPWRGQGGGEGDMAETEGAGRCAARHRLPLRRAAARPLRCIVIQGEYASRRISVCYSWEPFEG